MTPETAQSRSDFLPLIQAEAESGTIRDFSTCEGYHTYRDLARSMLKALDDECSKIIPILGKLAFWGIADWLVLRHALPERNYLTLVLLAALQFFPIVLLLDLMRLRKVFDFYFDLRNLNNEAESISPEAQMDLEFLIGKLETLGDLFYTFVGRPNVQR